MKGSKMMKKNIYKSFLALLGLSIRVCDKTKLVKY